MKTILFVIILTLTIPAMDFDAYKVLEFSWVSGNIMDYGTTRYALSNGFVEANGATAWYVNKNPGIHAAVKATLTVGVMYGMRAIKKKNKVLAHVLLAVLDVGIGYVVYSNIKEIRR